MSVQDTPLVSISSHLPTAVDLFSGGGGLTLGTELAGFQTLAAFDTDEDLTSTFTSNFPRVPLVLADLSVNAAAQVASVVGSRAVDCVVGGPPCQGFSEIGRREFADPRNLLIDSFMEVIAALLPAFFVMENVPALAHKGQMPHLKRALGIAPKCYVLLPPLVLNAADFGAPTVRKRLVVIGYDPSRLAEVRPEDFLSLKMPRVSVRQAISDIPPPCLAEPFAAMPYRAGRPSRFAALMRAAPPDGLGCAAARDLHRKGLVSGLQPTIHSQKVSRRFDATPSGGRESVSRYPRLDWDAPSPVLRAGTGRDHGSFQAARPIHPDEPRVITVREAARIQGFPDWVQFHPTRWHSHRMIGNSVSPVFAQAVLTLLRERLLEPKQLQGPNAPEHGSARKAHATRG